MVRDHFTPYERLALDAVQRNGEITANDVYVAILERLPAPSRWLWSYARTWLLLRRLETRGYIEVVRVDTAVGQKWWYRARRGRIA